MTLNIKHRPMLCHFMSGTNKDLKVRSLRSGADWPVGLPGDRLAGPLRTFLFIYFTIE